MDNKEAQNEEREVLQSIYEGDENFKELNPTTFQYRVGDIGHFKSFLLEIAWGDNYPTELPNINFDAFYNNHICPKVKSNAVMKINEEGEQWRECAMTYTLFEWAKENAESLMVDQVEEVIQAREPSVGTDVQQTKKVKEKKEHLTKAQKRKMADKTDFKGERPRGWDWVDIVKHLSRTGRTNADA
ncbi:RWD domain-containing protein 4-like [Anneissia japonica]|uniref:RWD domain-containing protein 4-like n=1 Tax=Anneissia japonica TaxID=1529436 RepID=UPI0014258C5B|nr:RWD domain-containing protein 4-like [Anneissia japonica]